jgi:hypothetical protein
MTSSGAARAALQQRHEMLDSLGLGATFGQPGGKGGPHPDDGWVALCDAFDRLLLPGAAVHQVSQEISRTPFLRISNRAQSRLSESWES